MQDERSQTLALHPCHDARVERGVREREEHLHILIERVVIARRHKLCQESPMAWRCFRVRPMFPIFGDHFLLIGEGGAELDEFFGLIEIRGSPELCWAE
jgi:hypothetical protein